MSETREDETRNAGIDTCPTCGNRVRVVGKITMHYEPVHDPALQAKYDAMMEAYAAAGDENLDLQLTVAELRAVVDSMKRIEAQRYKSAADALGLTPPAQAAAKWAGGTCQCHWCRVAQAAAEDEKNGDGDEH